MKRQVTTLLEVGLGFSECHGRMAVMHKHAVTGLTRNANSTYIILVSPSSLASALCIYP
jgi:hypothetical protein